MAYELPAEELRYASQLHIASVTSPVDQRQVKTKVFAGSFEITFRNFLPSIPD